MKRLFFFLTLTFALVACNKNRDTPIEDEVQVQDTPANFDYTATSEVKTVVYKKGFSPKGHIYKDFHRRFTIDFSGSSIQLTPEERSGDSFSSIIDHWSHSNEYAGLLNIGKVSSITDITSHTVKVGDGGRYSSVSGYGSGFWYRTYYHVSIEPGEGVQIVVRDENGEDHYIRVFYASYQLDEEDSISQAVYKYQLY
jgi:hypothetical protein